MPPQLAAPFYSDSFFRAQRKPAGANRRAVSDAQTSLALTAVRRAATVLKKDAKASKSFATDSRSEIRPPPRIPDSGGIMPTLRFMVGASILINASTATTYGRRVSYFSGRLRLRSHPSKLKSS